MGGVGRLTFHRGGNVGMGFFKRLLGISQVADAHVVQAPPTFREAAEDIVREVAREAGEQLVEVDVKGESYHQAELERVAGPKDAEGKQHLVGVTLRCEPENPHDSNAVRVEVMGLLVGHVPRDIAAILSEPMRRSFGGVVEARGMIVGGWKAPERDRFGDRSEGSFGIRVWITTNDTDRLGVFPDDVDPSLAPPWPTLPPVASGETRMGPHRDGRLSQVTVTYEEHYQDVILAARPVGWRDRSWPLLVDLVPDVVNPHSARSEPCVCVRIGDAPVGYFTPAMSQRHQAAITAATRRGKRVTASATASLGTKAGETIWRLRVVMPAG